MTGFHSSRATLVREPQEAFRNPLTETVMTQTMFLNVFQQGYIQMMK